MSNIPVFGHIKPGVKYVERPGAYAFLANKQGELAVVQTSFGFFLPGGGIDHGEDGESALRRELDEEIGYELTHAVLVTQAAQYHWSEFYQQHFKKVGWFYEVHARAPTVPRFQAEHALLWWEPAVARAKLTQEFQRWAVGQRA